MNIFNTYEYFDLNGRLHRENGPAAKASYGEFWYIHGNLHRENGPAIEYTDGDNHWYYQGKRHREDGPAVEFYDIRRVVLHNNLYYLHGKLINCKTNEEFLRIVKAYALR